MPKPSPRYPVATIAAYGPDNTLATKLVVAILDKNDHVLEQRIWKTHAVDVRHDRVIAADVAGFLKERGARETVSHDRIIGCPHEEGVDYPMGRVCPACPFWARIDRFTHEPLETPNRQ